MNDEVKKILHTANPHIKQPNKGSAGCSPIIFPSSNNSRLLMPQCTLQEHKKLSALSHHAGGAATLALAELIDDLKVPNFASDLNTFGGNGIGVAAQASNFMVKDIAHYDKLLKEYHDLKNHRAVPVTLSRKEAELKRAFKKMNASLDRKGQQILHKHAVKTKEVLNASGRVVRESIPLSNNIDVQRLAKLAKFGRVAGPGFILLDGYFRYDKVATMYKQNNVNWKREAVIQISGFTAGLLAGAAIVFVIGFAPVGLVVGLVAATGLINKGYDLLVY
jgi:hypothetical protein